MADIIITNDDLKDPSIDDMINLQRSAQPQGGEKIADIRTPFYFNPIFYYCIAATCAAVLVWAIREPYYDDNKENVNGFIELFLNSYMLFGPVAGAMSMFIGLVYGAVNRNWKQAGYCGVVGLGVGLGVTIITTIIATIFYMLASIIAIKIAQGGPPPAEGEYPLRGMAFFVHMCGRGIAWSIISIGAGMGLGVALKSRALTLNGFVGGLLGGLLGGFLFDIVERFVSTPGGGAAADHDAWMCRFIGLVMVGIFVGAFIGFFENISKESWFQMLKGPLAGKNFILFKNHMRIGSSPKSDIYLFKDPDVAPQHASVIRTGSRYMLQDDNSEKGVFVNGKQIQKYILQPSDTVTIGETVLRYQEKRPS